MPTASGKRRREKRPSGEAPEAWREPPLLHRRRGRRRRKRRGGASSSSRIAAGLVCFQLLLLLAPTVSGQYTDGGVVELDCTSCSCEGSAGDSEVLVFDNPSSGQRVRESTTRLCVACFAKCPRLHTAHMSCFRIICRRSSSASETGHAHASASQHCTAALAPQQYVPTFVKKASGAGR